MKNLLFTIALVCVTSLAFGQLKVVAPNGDVGIGTSTPTDKLSVEGNLSVAGTSNATVAIGKGRAADGIARINFTADESAWAVGLKIQRLANGQTAFFHRGTAAMNFNAQDGAPMTWLTGGVIAMNVSPTGNVGVGLINAADKLAVNGDITATGTVTWSDARLKENVNSFDLGLEELLQIQPMSYDYNGKAGIESNINHVGVIAQEFEEIMPDAVVERGYYEMREGNDEPVLVETYKGVDESVITYLLVNSIKEQQAQIEALTAQVEALTTSGTNGNTNSGSATDFSQQQMVLSNLASQEISKISPNPFTNVARIDYNLPRDFTSAFVTVYDVDGQLINRVALDTKIGTVEIEANQLSSGMYTYTIEVDGEALDTKKFIKE